MFTFSFVVNDLGRSTQKIQMQIGWIARYTKVSSTNTLEALTTIGNQQWSAVDSIKHCEKRLPLK